MIDFHNKTKQECREYAKELRNSLNMAQISNEICNNIKKQDFFNFSDNVLSFYPFNNEVDLRPLYRDSSKKWYLPEIEMETRSLLIHQYKQGDTLVKNKWGVSEPSERLEVIDPATIDVAIIPALMVDKKGHRLGYGAGFYDRFVPGLRKDCLKIVPITEELFVGTLPHDHWDIPVDRVVTQRVIYNL